MGVTVSVAVGVAVATSVALGVGVRVVVTKTTPLAAATVAKAGSTIVPFGMSTGVFVNCAVAVADCTGVSDAVGVSVA